MERSWTKHYDPGVPATLDFEQKTVVDFLDDAAARWPDRPALTLKGKTLTYRELKDQVDRFATGLARLGVGKDSRVALWLPNLPPMVIGFFATLRLGAQVVNANPLYVEREIEHQFNDAGVSVVVTLDYLWMGRLRGILSRTPVRHVIVTSIPDYLPFPLNLLAPLKLKKTGQIVKVPAEPNVHCFKERGRVEPARAAEGRLLSRRCRRPAVHRRHHRRLEGRDAHAPEPVGRTASSASAWFPTLEPGREVLLACLPYFHVFGMTVSMIWPVLSGMHIVLAPNPRDIATW